MNLSVRGLLLGAALFLCGISTAIASPVAYTIVTNDEGAKTAVILTDDFHDVCPVEANAAVLYTKEGFVKDILGCWYYDGDTDEINVAWVSESGDTLYTKFPASSFKRMSQDTSL